MHFERDFLVVAARGANPELFGVSAARFLGSACVSRADLGVQHDDGELRFQIEDVSTGAGRIVASFHFLRNRTVRLDGNEFVFQAGDAVRLFYSWRYSPARVKTLLNEHGLQVTGEWITASEEEGVFLCGRK